MSDKLSPRLRLIIFFVISFFALVYGSISLVNHYNFRTYAFDLGIETNTIYDYAHFRVNDCMLMQPQFKNVLSDHFSLLHFGYAWLIYIFGSYTLPLVHIFMILLGGFGIFRFVSLRSANSILGIYAMIYFFTMWGIYSALAFDVHNNVIGAMFVPWIFYYFEKRNFHSAFLCFVLVMIAKENMPLWTFFISLGLLILNFKDKQKRKFLLCTATLSLVYFVLVMNVFMPALANDGTPYLHFEYHSMGNNFKEVIVNSIKHPLKLISLFFTNHNPDPFYNPFKSELYFIVLVSGGITLFISPAYALMLLPIFGQKVLSNDPLKWGLAYHYSIEFASIITIATFSLIAEIKKEKLKYLLAALAISMSVWSTFYAMNKAKSIPYMRANLQFLEKEHYKRDFNIKDVYELMKIIPPDANVSASSEIVPHLSLRQYIYMFPEVALAEYIIILDNEINYPLTPEENKEEIRKLQAKPDWKLIKQQGAVYLFKKNI